MRKVLNPNVCTNPQSAQIGLMRWRTDVQRLSALGCMPPDFMMSYRALESIFGTVFDKAEPEFHMRWIQLKNRLGQLHLVTPEAPRSKTTFQRQSNSRSCSPMWVPSTGWLFVPGQT